jgi:hypothetical protein
MYHQHLSNRILSEILKRATPFGQSAVVYWDKFKLLDSLLSFEVPGSDPSAYINISLFFVNREVA